MIIGLSHQIPEFNNIDPYSGNTFFPTLKYIKINNGIQNTNQHDSNARHTNQHDSNTKHRKETSFLTALLKRSLESGEYKTSTRIKQFMIMILLLKN